VLKEISKIMKEYVRQVDLIGRYGGEEFVIALPDTDKNSAVNVADRIRMSVEKHKFRAYDETISMTISIGVATFPETGEDVAMLIDRADQALYKAKEAGRNKVVLWP
jgi:diguanylate cyclase